MILSKWPQEERPREKLISQGVENLSDSELLALLLRTGTPGKTAVDLARTLINNSGGLSNLLQTDQNTLCKTAGIGIAKFSILQAVNEINKRVSKNSLKRGAVLKNSVQTKEFMISHLKHKHHEVFACLFLDNQHQMICFDEIFRGTINKTAVHPREIVKITLKHNAAAVILAHNHPSGSITPSDSDKKITSLVKNALETIEVKTLDHIIVGDNETFSFAENDLM